MNGRNKIKEIFKGNSIEDVAAGEIIIANRLIQKGGFYNGLEDFLVYLSLDIVSLPIKSHTPPLLWRYWAKKDYFVFGLLQGPFTMMIEDLGWQKASYVITNQQHQTAGIIGEYAHRGIISAQAALDSGCDGIILADDLAGNQGLMVAPDFLRSCYFPVINNMLNQVQSDNNPVIFHSDGNILDIIGDIKCTGFRGIHSLQPSAGMNTDTISDDIMKNMVFWGNFEFELGSRMKTNNEVKNEVGDLLERWNQKKTGYIFGSSGGLYEGIPIDIIKTAYDSVAQLRKRNNK